MAALMIFQLGYGWYLGWQPVGGDKYLGYQTHTEVGLTIMLLGSLRFFWHSQLSGPDNVDEDVVDRPCQPLAAALVLLQLLRVADQRLGDVVHLPSDLPLSVAGVIPFPNLPFDQLSEGLQHR
jgi:cytochrome b561